MEYLNFCDELKEKSKAIHAKSDKIVRIKLAVALTDIKLYQQMLFDFYCIFNAIEEGIISNISHPFLSNLWKEEFRRSQLIEKDLEYFGGLTWRCSVHPSKAALEYASHINSISQNEPELLVAYIHSMYLAVFSGGQILQSIIKKTLGISGPDGLQVFALPAGYSRGQVKNHIKDTINDMIISQDVKDRIIQEKLSIFERNNVVISTIDVTFHSFARIFKILAFVLFAIFCFYMLS